jgi:hypothetical protein
MLKTNRFLLVSALAVAAAACNVAFADDITIDPTPFVSTKSEAQVLAEMKEFRASGVNPWSGSYNPLASFNSTRTRDEVKAEFLASRQETQAFMGEDSGSTYLPANSQAGRPIQAARQLAAQ